MPEVRDGLPYIEVYLGNLGGRGAPAAEFGQLMLAMHNILSVLTEHMEDTTLIPVMCEPTLGVEPDRIGHELAVAVCLAPAGPRVVSADETSQEEDHV